MSGSASADPERYVTPDWSITTSTVDYAIEPGANAYYDFDYEGNWALFEDFDDANGTPLTEHEVSWGRPWLPIEDGAAIEISSGSAVPQDADQTAIAAVLHPNSPMDAFHSTDVNTEELDIWTELDPGTATARVLFRVVADNELFPTSISDYWFVELNGSNGYVGLGVHTAAGGDSVKDFTTISGLATPVKLHILSSPGISGTDISVVVAPT